MKCPRCQQEKVVNGEKHILLEPYADVKTSTLSVIVRGQWCEQIGCDWADVEAKYEEVLPQ